MAEDSKQNIDIGCEDSLLKLKTARTIKWNAIDRVSSQILYAITGIVLANVLPKEDFGLIGAILVFQAFAILFVDSGFGAALLQTKNPDEKDYSTVFWFNLVVSVFVYIVLWFAAPFISEIFKDDRLIMLSRTMFLCFIINGLAIVQTNRLMKQMNVKMIALSNMFGLVISGIVGILMALNSWGAWALVWQSITLALIKTIWLWSVGNWIPHYGFCKSSFRKIYRVGVGVFASSFLNTVFQNIYSFVIGTYYNLVSLGDYTQADKWSKMGSASLSQIFTASFVPVLSKFQSDRKEYCRIIGKVNRFAAFVVFPFLGGLAIMAEPIFHILFGTKWDSAIILFQLLAVRGIFVVLSNLYNNYLLALGYAKSLVLAEIVKDVIVLVAIVSTIFMQSLELLVWGQMVAGVVTYLFMLWLVSRKVGYKKSAFIVDMLPYFILTLVIVAILWVIGIYVASDILQFGVDVVVGLALYCIVLKISGSTIFKEACEYVFGRFQRRSKRLNLN